MGLVKKYAIDFGTRTTQVWDPETGESFSEPTVLAWDATDHRLLSFGSEAINMAGKEPEYIEIIFPVLHGVIRDYEAATLFIKQILKKAARKWWLFGPEILVPIAYGTNQVEQKALVDAIKSAGARKVMLIDAPLATALGAKIPIAETFGNMILQLGDGMCEAAVMAMGGVVVAKSMRFGGYDIDIKLIETLKKQHTILIGEQAARLIREKYLYALRPKHPENIEIKGLDTVYGLPKVVTINTVDLYEMLKDGFAHIASLAVSVISQTPPELVADIMDRGLVVSGGLIQTKDLIKFLTQTLNVAVHVANDPETCTIRGAGMILENLEVYERAIR